MKKVFSDKLRIRLDERGRPLVFSLDAKGRYPVDYRVVNILGWWREPGQWWEGEPVTLYLRLQAVTVGTGPRIFELYRTEEGWYFHRLLG